MYQLTNGTTIIRTIDGACIPADEGNADFQAYQVWLAAGNTPDPIPAPTSDEQKSDLLGQIAALESSSLMPRALRDIILKDPANAAYTKTKALDDQITALREQIKSLG